MKYIQYTDLHNYYIYNYHSFFSGIIKSKVRIENLCTRVIPILDSYLKYILTEEDSEKTGLRYIL